MLINMAALQLPKLDVTPHMQLRQVCPAMTGVLHVGDHLLVPVDTANVPWLCATLQAP